MSEEKVFRKSRGHGNNETAKIRDLVMPYLRGVVADYGCGNEKVLPTAIGVDRYQASAADIKMNLDDLTNCPIDAGRFDTVFSSHFLEHTKSPESLLRHWHHVLKDDGKLVLYLPDDRWYDNAANDQHLHAWTYPVFMGFIESLDLFDVVASGEHYVPDYAYSFWLVARKRR